MIVKSLSVSGFRNLEDQSLEPCDSVNILFGDNAQGKTNLIESIWLFTGEKSFRGSRDSEIIQFGKQFSSISLSFESGSNENTARIRWDTGKAAFLNGVELKSPSELSGEFCSVVFSPEHLNLVKEGPHFRREFLDDAICQLMPRYDAALTEYRRSLSQRNALLKDIPRHSELLDTIEIWNDRLSSAGAFIVYSRLRYVRTLLRYAKENYAGISNQSENFSVSYKTPENTSYEVSSEGRSALQEIRTQLLESIKKSIVRDVELGYTQTGPHRDDLDIQINGLSARLYGSQGQQRSAVLSLKLAEAAVLKESLNQPPVLLLDDVMSELDKTRQDYLLNHIDGWQVFITCCDPSGYENLHNGRIFEVRKGKITEKMRLSGSL